MAKTYSYNRILGYSKDETENAGYWKNQLPSYQKTIDLHKIQIQETIQSLEEKGVNVSEIEKQTKSTENHIRELDEKLESILMIKEKLTIQYKREKEERLMLNQNFNYEKDRSEENKILFSTINNSTASQNNLDKKFEMGIF